MSTCTSTAKFDGMYVQAPSTLVPNTFGTASTHCHVPAPRTEVPLACRADAGHSGKHHDHLSVPGVLAMWQDGERYATTYSKIDGKDDQ